MATHQASIIASGLGLGLGLDFGYHVTNELDVALHIEFALAACGPNTAQRSQVEQPASSCRSMQLQYKRRKSYGEQYVAWWNSMQLAWLHDTPKPH